MAAEQLHVRTSGSHYGHTREVGGPKEKGSAGAETHVLARRGRLETSPAALE